MRTSTAHEIFISYRRVDTADVVGRLWDHVVRDFDEKVFRDASAISVGVDFKREVDRALARVKVVIAVIGPAWAADGSVSRRLDDANHLVRIAVETALKCEIDIIPVLVKGASFPTEHQLPESIRPLASINGLEIGADFRTGYEKLENSLTRYLIPQADQLIALYCCCTERLFSERTRGRWILRSHISR